MKYCGGILRSARRVGAAGLLMALAVTLSTPSFTRTVKAVSTQTININTGYDQWLATPALIPVGGPDNEWRVVVDPTSPPPPNGRPSDVVDDAVWFGFNPTLHTSYPDSRWISVNPASSASGAPPVSYQYAYYFTLPQGFSSPLLTMKLSSDDHITNVSLNTTTLFPGPSGGVFINPPLILSTSSLSSFNSGSNVNVITVTVEDTAGGITGLIVGGELTYDDCDDRLPIKNIPGLTSLTFWESTFGAPAPFTFQMVGPELTAQLLTLGPGSNDFEGASGEYYDVFYSNWNGSLAPTTGQFVTIEAVWPVGAPAGGGLNLAAVQFNFGSGSPQFANSVASFVALGNNAIPADVGKAVDGNLSTDTTMGNTIGQTQRLRITVGLPCCVPPPSGMVAWWPLDELTGAFTINDIALPPGSIFNNAGTPQPGGQVGFPDGPNAVNGQVSGALYCYPGHFVQVQDQGEINFGKFDLSIDAWVNPVQVLPALLQPIVDKLAVPFPLPNPPTGTGYALYLLGDKLYFVIGDGGPFETYSSITPIPSTPNTWTHVAVTVARNTNTVTLYINGAPDVLQPAVPALPAGSITNSTDLLIGNGRLVPIGELVEITIDELEIFNRAISLQEVQDIYDAGPAGKCKKKLVTVSVPGVNGWVATAMVLGMAGTLFFLLKRRRRVLD